MELRADALSGTLTPDFRKMASSPISLLLCLLAPALGYVDRGILKLDNTTFDRIVDGSRPVFVRFDKEYSYGDEVLRARCALPLR